jgi:thiamine biosynthesis protein ThiS
MNITVNGSQHVHQGNGSLAELLKELNARPDLVAIVVNGRMVLKSERVSVRLRDGDQVEILTFIGGG